MEVWTKAEPRELKTEAKSCGLETNVKPNVEPKVWRALV